MARNTSKRESRNLSRWDDNFPNTYYYSKTKFNNYSFPGVVIYNFMKKMLFHTYWDLYCQVSSFVSDWTKDVVSFSFAPIFEFNCEKSKFVSNKNIIPWKVLERLLFTWCIKETHSLVFFNASQLINKNHLHFHGIISISMIMRFIRVCTFLVNRKVYYQRLLTCQIQRVIPVEKWYQGAFLPFLD